MAQTSYCVTIGHAHRIGSFNTAFYTPDEDAQIMRWLSPLEPDNRHQGGVPADRFEGVGDWFLEMRE